MLRVAWTWLPVILVAAAIFVQSSLPAMPIPFRWPHIDKIAHAGVFLVLSALLVRAFAITAPGWKTRYVALAAIACAALYGATDEWHQMVVPGRTADWMDWIFDAAGAIAGAVGYASVRVHRGR